MTALPQESKTYTLEDWYNLPESNELVELIDGHICHFGTPSTQHQEILAELVIAIGSYLKSRKKPCKILPSPFAVTLGKDGFQPDISVICDKTKLTDRGCMGAPDWIIEITSPSNASNDYSLKLDKYMAAGVREYWIVDPMTEKVLVYRSDTPKIIGLYTFSDTIPVGIFEGFSIDFSQLNI
jgi:Uma2 family endonuclease